MDESFDELETRLIDKYKLTRKSTNQEILQAAQQEYSEALAGSVAASVRYILKH